MSSKMDEMEKNSIDSLARTVKTNLYIAGEMQFSDITNRDFFIKAYSHRVRYCISWNKFLIWNGTCWQIDTRGRVEEMCVDFIHIMYRALRSIEDTQLKIIFEKHLVRSESYRRIQGMVGLLKMSKDIKVEDFEMDRDNYLFNTSTQTINLKTNKIKDPTNKDLITKKSNFIFDKTAQCPIWNMFLQQIFNQDVELIHFVQKAMGYSLSGDTSEQCLFILWGIGANGKSTFLNVLQHLFGDYAGSTGTDTFMKKSSEHSNDIARLKGLRLVTTNEVEQGKPLSESLIKQITGEDEMTARFLYGEYFSFKPTFKIFMATNHKPKIRGADNGIWRRIKMIPFNVTIPPEQRDKKLTEKLIAENAGILNWLIQGYVMWKKEGLGEEPKAVKEANEEYRMDMDSVGMFVTDCLQTDPTLKWRLPTALLYQTYIKWCNKNNERVMSQKWLGMRMSEKGFKRVITNGQRLWCGLCVKGEWMAMK